MKEIFPPLAPVPARSTLLQERESRSLARLAGIALALMVAGFVLAMALVPIGGAVIAAGQVAPESKVKQVAHPTGGVVSAIAVHDGDHVRAGQVLLRLDTSVSAIDADVSGRSLDQLLARRARLQAELDERGMLTFPEELSARRDGSAIDAMDEERRRFALDRAEQASLIGQVNERINQLRRQIDSYAIQIDALQQQQALIAPELQGVRSLKSRGYVTIHQLNELERTAVQLGGSQGALRAQIAQAQAAISQAGEQRIQIRQSARTDAGEELAKVAIAINSQRVSHAAADVTHDRLTIRAPYPGVVDKLAVTAIGDVVKPADTILTIVPDEDRPALEAAVAPSDIDRVRQGQPARIRLSAFSRSETPEFRGRVAFVSAQTLADQRDTARFYRIRVLLDAADERAARKLGMVAGMPVEVYIETGQRSMLSYITKPLRDQFERAFRD